MITISKALIVLAILAKIVRSDDAEDGKKPEEQVVDVEVELGTVIGIDLGTTYSCVGVYRNGRVEIIPNDQGNRITPSYVAFTADGQRLIGDAAKNQLTTNPENTIFDVKRLIGRPFHDENVQADAKLFPFVIVEQKGKPYVLVDTNKEETNLLAPEEISAMILLKMKETAEAYLGTVVTHAVVTVPAYFNDAQRKSTKDAAAIAGLNVLRIINEPTAAAIAYGLDKLGSEKTILVFDLGGGTFDVSILTIENGVFEVVATSGDTHLGGEDFDQRVMDYLIDLYQQKNDVDVRTDVRAVQKLRREVEKAKRSLSSNQVVRIEIESFYNGQDFSETLTRAKFEELNMDLFKSTLKTVEKVLHDADMSSKGIDEIVLVGGSTRIPKIKQLVQDFFGGKEPSDTINPDEAVAFGAAVQAGVLSGEEHTDSIVLLDVCPLTVGIETAGGVMAKLIPRNTIIPAKVSQEYTTTIDKQTFVTIQIFEGERALTEHNHLLGKFTLDGIPEAPRGQPRIIVTFEIDANGILQVTAQDKATGKKENIVITNDENRLKPDEMERMIRDADRFADDDRKARERIDARNDLESEAYGLRRELPGIKIKLGDRIDPEDTKKIEDAIQVAIDWLELNPSAETAEYIERKEKLATEVHKYIKKLQGVKPSEKKPVKEAKPVESESVEEAKPVESEPVKEAKPSEKKPVKEAKPVESESVEEVKPVESEPVKEAKPSEKKPVKEAKPVGSESVEEAKPVESEPVKEAKPSEKKPVKEAKPVKSEPVKEAKPVQSEPVKEAKTVQSEPVEEPEDGAVETESVDEEKPTGSDPSTEDILKQAFGDLDLEAMSRELDEFMRKAKEETPDPEFVEANKEKSQKMKEMLEPVLKSMGSLQADFKRKLSGAAESDDMDATLKIKDVMFETMSTLQAALKLKAEDSKDDEPVETESSEEEQPVETSQTKEKPGTKFLQDELDAFNKEYEGKIDAATMKKVSDAIKEAMSSIDPDAEPTAQEKQQLKEMMETVGKQLANLHANAAPKSETVTEAKPTIKETPEKSASSPSPPTSGNAEQRDEL